MDIWKSQNQSLLAYLKHLSAEGPGDNGFRFTNNVSFHLEWRTNLDLLLLQVLAVDLWCHCGVRKNLLEDTRYSCWFKYRTCWEKVTWKVPKACLAFIIFQFSGGLVVSVCVCYNIYIINMFTIAKVLPSLGPNCRVRDAWIYYLKGSALVATKFDLASFLTFSWMWEKKLGQVFFFSYSERH